VNRRRNQRAQPSWRVRRPHLSDDRRDRAARRSLREEHPLHRVVRKLLRPRRPPEHVLLVGRDARVKGVFVDVVVVVVVFQTLDDRPGELDGVFERQVHALAREGRHEVRRVAQERHPRPMRPSEPDGEHVQRPRDHRAVVGVLRETDEFGRPVREFLADGPFGGRAVVDVVAAVLHPVLVAHAPRVDVDAAVAHLLAHDRLAVGEGEERAAVDELVRRGRGLLRVGDHEAVARDAGVVRLLLGEQVADLAPGAVGADDEVKPPLDAAVVEVEGVVLVVHPAQAIPPSDDVLRDGVQEQRTQLGAINLRPAYRVLLRRCPGVAEVRSQFLVAEPERLALEAGVLEELLVQAGLLQGRDARLGVEVQRAALAAEVDRLLSLEDGDFYRGVGDEEESSEHAAGRAGADDCQFHRHDGILGM